MHKICRAIAALTVMFISSVAYSSPVTIEYSAIIEFAIDPENALNGQAEPGIVISGKYKYDTDSPDLDPSSEVGRYRFMAPSPFELFEMVAEVNGLRFETNPSAFGSYVMSLTNHDPRGDSYSVASFNNLPLPTGMSVDRISLRLDDPTGAALSSTEVSGSAPVVEDWESASLDIRGGSCCVTQYWIHARVMSMVQVP